MPSSRGDDFRINGVEPAHVRAVLRALARVVSPGTADAVRHYFNGQLTELPRDAVAEIAREADRYLPSERSLDQMAASGEDTRRRSRAKGTS